MDRTDDDSLPPTPRTESFDEPHTPEPPSDVDEEHGSTDDEALDVLEDLLRHLRIRIKHERNQRNALQDRVQVLEGELGQLRVRNTELVEASRLAQAQLDAFDARFQAAENDHAVEADRLSQQVAREEQRAAGAEEAHRLARAELAGANRRIAEFRAAANNDTLQTLRRSFGDRIAEALTSTPVPDAAARYRMTGTTPARGPDRRRHPEFEPADGPGRFITFRGRLAWIKIWLQTQA